MNKLLEHAERLEEKQVALIEKLDAIKRTANEGWNITADPRFNRIYELAQRAQNEVK